MALPHCDFADILRLSRTPEALITLVVGRICSRLSWGTNGTPEYLDLFIRHDAVHIEQKQDGDGEFEAFARDR